jgi:hypothetical protein
MLQLVREFIFRRRTQAMHQHHSRGVLGNRAQHVRVAFSRGDVIHSVRAGADGFRGDCGARRVHTDWNVDAGVTDRPNHGNNTLDLFRRRNERSAGACRFPTNIEHVGAFSDGLPRSRQGGLDAE